MKTFETTFPVDPARHVYVERAADHQLPTLLAAGTHCNLHAGRQAGKTSIVNKVMRSLREDGHRPLYTSFILHAVDAPDLATAVTAMCAALSMNLVKIAGRRAHHRAKKSGKPSDIFIHFLEHAAKHCPPGRRLPIFIDEFDAVLRFRPDEVAGFLFPLRDYCQAAERSITLAIVSVRTVVDMVPEHTTGGGAPLFARDVSLPLFSNDAATRLQLISQGFADNDRAVVEPLVKEVLELTGGQPYLTCLLLGELQRASDRPTRLSELTREYVESGGTDLQGHFGVIRKQLLESGPAIYTLVETFERIQGGARVSTQSGGAGAIALESIGLVRAIGGEYRVTCPIYERHLTRQWMEDVVTLYETTAIHRKRAARGRSPKRIALLLTGGTIGMVTTEGKQSTFQGADPELHAFVKAELSALADVEPFKLFDPPLDGINVAPREWKRIAEWIHSHRSDFDGFVVAHGTDTLAFTASAVAFMFGPALAFPIVFTGAQTTIDLEYGDTRDNLKRACFVAAHSQAIREVQVLFGDLVLRAVRAEKADDRLFEGFRSPAWPPLARVTEHLLINEYALGGRPDRVYDSDYRPFTAGEIMVVPIVPGLRPERYQRMLLDAAKRKDHLDGVIITTPGVGNIPFADGYNFRPFIQDAVARGIPVLIASQVPINPYTQAQYEATRVPEEFGAILTGNITPTAAMAKFSWVIGWTKTEVDRRVGTKQYLDTIRTRMKANYVGEQGEYELSRPNTQ